MSDEFDDALAVLKRRFLARSADDLGGLRAWCAGGAPADEAARHTIHRLAGAAGTFGFHALSGFAKAADDRLAAGEAPEAGEAAALLGELQRVLDAAA